VSSSHRLALKFVAAAVILGGNCLVCPTMGPIAFAAEDHSLPAVDECADEAVASDASVDVPMVPDAASAIMVGSQYPPASECPMGGDSDGHNMTGYANVESRSGGTFTITPPPAAAAASPPASLLSNESDPSGQKVHFDRAPKLTGTTIKNE
jgi:hypothetical protein